MNTFAKVDHFVKNFDQTHTPSLDVGNAWHRRRFSWDKVHRYRSAHRNTMRGSRAPPSKKTCRGSLQTSHPCGMTNHAVFGTPGRHGPAPLCHLGQWVRAYAPRVSPQPRRWLHPEGLSRQPHWPDQLEFRSDQLPHRLLLNRPHGRRLPHRARRASMPLGPHHRMASPLPHHGWHARAGEEEVRARPPNLGERSACPSWVPALWGGLVPR